jgi:purine-binding chemotaxis protein CheW
MAVDSDSLLSSDTRNVSDSMKDQYLTFSIDNEDFGIEISYVQNIVRMQPITRVPDMPDYIVGITNLRGDLIGVLDVRKRFQKPPKDYDESNCIIFIEYNEYVLGLIVDSIKATVTIEASDICPPPMAKLNHHNQYIRNIGKVGKTVQLLLDMDRFLAQD